MKNTASILFVLLMFCISGFSQTGESGFKKVSVSGKKSNPPKIEVSVNLFDQNGNQSLEAGESGKLTINIKNTGATLAEDMTLKVFQGDVLKGLVIEPFDNKLGNLYPGSEKNVEVLLSTTSELPLKEVNFKIEIFEKDGFDSEPFILKVMTREKSTPSFAIENYAFSNETGGQIELGKVIDLKLTMTNKGDGKAENVVVSFTNPENVFPNGMSEFQFISIGPGEKKEIRYSFLPNELFTGTSIPIAIAVKEKTGNFGFTQIVSASLSAELLSTVKSETDGTDDMVYRGGGDPLKGLNLANAKKDMQVGDYYALIIGIDEYTGEWKKLNNAVNDAKTIEKLLASKYKFDKFRTLYNSAATRKEILQEFEWLVANVKPEDNVFIYYSGHGEFKKELNKGYWVPFDASTTSVADFISNNDIQTFLSGIKSKHTLLVADACFAGDIFRGKTISVPFENSEKYYFKVHDLPSRKALSSGGIEPVMDGGRDGHSVFAYYFIKALQENDSRFYDATQLYDRIKIPVVNNSEQSPSLNPIKNSGDEGGQFIFIKK